MNYWFNKELRAKQAWDHTKYMDEKYSEETESSVSNTIFFDDETPLINRTPLIRSDQRFVLEDIDTVSAIYKYHHPNIMKTVALNYASFKHPGGMFMKGSSAQEEALCHESNLYNVLSSSSLSGYYKYNRTHTASGLYLNRALYSPQIVFERNGIVIHNDILTCAAPNKRAYMLNYTHNDSNDHGYKLVRNKEALDDRIHFVVKIADSIGTDIFIIGAYGCGVFKQSASQVAFTFYHAIRHTGIRYAIFAIPDRNSKNFIDTEYALRSCLGDQLNVEYNNG